MSQSPPSPRVPPPPNSFLSFIPLPFIDIPISRDLRQGIASHIYRCNVLLDELTLHSSSPSTCVSMGWILFFAIVSTFYCHRWNKWWQIVAVVVVAFLARRVMQETIDEQPSSTATAANCPATGGRDFETTHPNTSPFIADKKRIVRKRITAAARFDWFWYWIINFYFLFFLYVYFVKYSTWICNLYALNY